MLILYRRQSLRTPMKNNRTTHKASTRLDHLLSDLAEIQIRVNALPPLSDVEKAKLDNALAIEQLYNSSKVEGTTLTNAMIERAIHGRRLSSS